MGSHAGEPPGGGGLVCPLPEKYAPCRWDVRSLQPRAEFTHLITGFSQPFTQLLRRWATIPCCGAGRLSA